MGENLAVNPAELVRSAAAHEARAEGWRALATNPPNDPDALATELGFVGHSFIESLRVHNAARARDADALAAGYGRDASALRAAAADYIAADETGADRIDGVIFAE
jgi:ABC-type phosphonate transport system ATPase subunit